MSQSQIQLYIDEKNWLKLAVVFFEIDYRRVRFTREFLDEFLLSGKYDYIFKNAFASSVETFFESLFPIIERSKIDLTKDDYVKIIDLALRFSNTKLTSYTIRKKIVKIDEYKNQEYIKLFLDPAFISKIKSINKEKEILEDTIFFSKKHFDGLKPEEVRKLLKNILTINPYINIRPDKNESWSIFTALASTPEELLEINLYDYGLRDASYGTILGDITTKQFKELVVHVLYDKTKKKKLKREILFSLFRYILLDADKTKEIEFTDSEIKKLSKINPYLLSNELLPCLSFEQMKKYADLVPLISIFKLVSMNKKLTVQQIGELFTLDNYDSTYEFTREISSCRFIREEDLLDAPHLFDPKALVEDAPVFCTEKTFNAIKNSSVWKGKREKLNWEKKLTEFKNLFYKNIEVMNIDDFKYLIEKTNASKEEIARSIKHINDEIKSIDEIKINDFNKKIIKVMRLLQKYQ